MREITPKNKEGRHNMDISRVGRYYVHERVNNNRHPLISVNEQTARRANALWRNDKIGADAAPYQLGIAYPKPRKPELVDHLSSSHPIVSSKIKEAIESLVFYSSEFIPAEIEMGKDRHPYWILHALQEHDVLDRPNSKFVLEETGSITWVDKLFIDYNRLAEIKLEERMLFLLGHTAGVYLWHEDIVKAVEATQATGIRFFPAEGFGQDAIFSP